MAGIWNINSVYNTNTKKISSKLSFEIGQVFKAKIVSANSLTNDLILKLLDGWQFSAKTQKPLDFMPKGLVKFVVEGFEDGKLQLRIAGEENIKEEDSKIDSFEEALREQNIGSGKEEYELLKKMVKHEMPLTKENISKVKTILDFKSKMSSEEEQDAFIQKYVESKNASIGSQEGKEIKNVLKSFFNQLKNTSEDELLTMYENGIDITKDNLESFQKITKDPSIIYKDLKEVKEDLKKADIKIENSIKNFLSQETEEEPMLQKLTQQLSSKDINSKEEYRQAIKEFLINESMNGKDQLPIDKKGAAEKSKSLDQYISYLEEQVEETQQNKPKREIDKINIPKKAGEQIEENRELKKNSADTDLRARNDKDLDGNSKVERSINSRVEQKNNESDKNEKTIAALKNSLGIKEKPSIGEETLHSETAKVVKEQIQEKTEQMKEVIKEIIDKKNELKPEVFSKIMDNLNNRLNDFKVFNSISNQYYYMDIPLNLKNNEYQCKLLIKDDRKKGKTLDSSNIKLVANVTTTHMGTVDAYIKVRENVMDVEMKCEENGMQALQLRKDNIIQILNSMGYSSHIYVAKKEKEVDLVSCREFFEDTDFNSINVRV